MRGRGLAGLSAFGREHLNFRHLLERLGKGLLDEINAHLESQGLRLREGTIVDASINRAAVGTRDRSAPVAFRDRAIGVDSAGVVHTSPRRDRGAPAARR